MLSILSSILTLVSAHYNDHSLGRLIMKTMLTPVKFRYLNSYVSGSRNELIILAFKLYNVMSNFAGGGDKNSVLENFAWETKVRRTLFENFASNSRQNVSIWQKF